MGQGNFSKTFTAIQTGRHRPQPLFHGVIFSHDGTSRLLSGGSVMIRLHPVQYPIFRAQLILFRNGHRTALARQIFPHPPALYSPTHSPEAPSERYRLIQFSMVEWPNLASRAASRIRSRPARYSSTSETFSSDASSFRFLICALSAVISLSVLLGAYQSVPQLFAIF